jgi:hypothetical protein
MAYEHLEDYQNPDFPDNPKCKRFFREYDGFTLCVNIGEKGYVFADHFNERFSAFYYLVSGAGKFGRLFDPNYLDMREKKILDVQDYLYDPVVFQATEDFHLIGFNIFSKNDIWQYRLITSEDKSITMGKETNYLVCLNGNATISGNSLKPYDGMKLEKDVEYTIDNLGDAEICIFSKIFSKAS